jgi:hypothetical protein
MNQKVVLASIFGVILLIVVGYFFLSPIGDRNKGDTASNLFKSETTSKTPVELILSTSALPEGFRVKDQAPRTRSEVSESGLNLGWKEGYYISFMKGETVFDATVIEQYISIYPVENMSLLVTPRENDEGITYESLDIEQIGDASRAYKVTESDEFFEQSSYVIEFRKKDVLMYLSVSGIEQNYEVLKDLAKKAASGI